MSIEIPNGNYPHNLLDRIKEKLNLRGNTMIKIQVQLTEEQIKALKKIANKKHVSIAELIRQGVDVLTRSSGEISNEERKKRAIAPAGQFRSGKKNISTRHDKYLNEAFIINDLNKLT